MDYHLSDVGMGFGLSSGIQLSDTGVFTYKKSRTSRYCADIFDMPEDAEPLLDVEEDEYVTFVSLLGNC